MGIQYFEKERIFKLDTKKTSYLIGIVDEEKFVCHIYYGKRLSGHRAEYLMRTAESPFLPSQNARDRQVVLDCLPMEYTSNGVGDYKESTISVKTKAGNVAVQPTFESYRIFQGKPKLEGLPATFGKEEECTTLEILCRDAVLNLEVLLRYSVFEDVDAIIRSVEITNKGEELLLTRALSACLDMDNRDFEMITLHGGWARERHMQRKPVGYGRQSVLSRRGETSHQDQPFMALVTPGTNQEMGEVYGFHLVYSGNFLVQTEVNQFDICRTVIGISPEDFGWKLETGEKFVTPEAVLVYSGEGLGQMTRTFHNLYRRHLIRGEYRNKKRPILINNWEATYFNFGTEKLLDIAREASALGIEMLVMDDGWFGNRCDDNRALGDWQVNEEKIQGGLANLVEKVNQMGMKFGIWFEPEMISPDSNLYRQHPDWAIAVPGRTPALGRNQYVLDLTRKEVRDYVYQCVADVLHSANIEYVKWDMNRQLTDIGSAQLPPERMGEFYHRYVLAVYEMQERLIQEFPHLLLENCSGGGARFDPGMLYYSPQIWCSDDIDPVERLVIHEGTAMIYPLSAMGAHVADCPNHTVGRTTPFETRGYVALAGTFGYELDVTKISEEERAQIPGQVAMYHKYNDLVREGDYYRIASYRENHYFDCWEVVSEDKKEALVTFIQVLSRPNVHSRCLKLQGLDASKKYRVEETGEVFDGDVLMYGGILIPAIYADFQGRLIHLIQVEE